MMSFRSEFLEPDCAERGGYERVYQPGVTDLNAPVLSAGLEFRPNANSRITIEGGERYKRSTWAARAEVQVSDRIALTGRYTEVLAPDQLHLANAFTDFVAATAELPAPTTPTRFRYQENLYDQTSYDKRGEVHVLYSGASNVIDVSAQLSDRRFVVTGGRDRSASADVRITSCSMTYQPVYPAAVRPERAGCASAAAPAASVATPVRKARRSSSPDS